MKSTSSVSEVSAIMLDYAAISGLSPLGKTPSRYLWTYGANIARSTW